MDNANTNMALRVPDRIIRVAERAHKMMKLILSIMRLESKAAHNSGVIHSTKILAKLVGNGYQERKRPATNAAFDKAIEDALISTLARLVTTNA